MISRSKILIEKYFEKNSFVNSQIESFNNFIEYELQKIIEENKDIEPTIIPHNIDEFKIRLDKIWVKKPEIIEADGSRKDIMPVEARLRKLSYSAPVFIEISSHINGVQRESIQTQIANLPIMLKSKFCHLYGMNKDELIKNGEDPYDPGGYFVINGTEKVLISIEDLASNNFLLDKKSSSAKLFSEEGSFKIPHTIEKQKDGVFYLSFTRVRDMPVFIIIKALGITKDEEILNLIISQEKDEESAKKFLVLMHNAMEFSDIKTEEQALDFIAKKIGITQSKDIKLERTQEILDKYLLPHIGLKKEDRNAKAYNLCKMMRRYILKQRNNDYDDKDHYMNKRIKMSGDLLADLIRVNLKVLIGDLLYNFQRIVKRGKFPSIKVVIREKLLTQRIYSSMATGAWVAGRKGITQRMQRLNHLETLSHLQRVVSPLSAEQENFEARELHPTHLGRLCPIETPEGTNIGLRKNLSLLCSISKDDDEKEVIKSLKNLGLKSVW
jgi:DNA-directed RNA polymerase subunit B